MFRGIRIDCVKPPVAPAWNGKVWRVLCSWISPIWLAGTRVAVTRTDSPATTVDGDSETDGLAAQTANAPMRSRTSTAAAPNENSRLRDFFFVATGWATSVGLMDSGAGAG